MQGTAKRTQKMYVLVPRHWAACAEHIKKHWEKQRRKAEQLVREQGRRNKRIKRGRVL